MCTAIGLRGRNLPDLPPRASSRPSTVSDFDEVSSGAAWTRPTTAGTTRSSATGPCDPRCASQQRVILRVRAPAVPVRAPGPRREQEPEAGRRVGRTHKGDRMLRRKTQERVPQGHAPRRRAAKLACKSHDPRHITMAMIDLDDTRPPNRCRAPLLATIGRYCRDTRLCTLSDSVVFGAGGAGAIRVVGGAYRSGDFSRSGVATSAAAVAVCVVPGDTSLLFPRLVRRRLVRSTPPRATVQISVSRRGGESVRE
jgi:hypothetical protein